MKKTYVRFTTAFVLAMSFLPGLIRADVVPGAAPDGTTESLPPPLSLHMRITAYSSSLDETDSSPLYTANGTHVRDGIVATNLLPLGTKIEIPSLFGDKVFTVEDRMAKRFQKTIDIWMPTKGKALFFGVSYADVVILDEGISTSTAAAIHKAVVSFSDKEISKR